MVNILVKARRITISNLDFLLLKKGKYKHLAGKKFSFRQEVLPFTKISTL
jgi:hypothetical protein